MKDVSFVFHNIQSHAHTEFSLHPGLNFILANDNNVGKSTIFKAITFAVRMPRYSYEEANELLRVGTSQGYMSASFDSKQVVLWFFREAKDKIKVFFEIKSEGGTSTRSLDCPKDFLDALDIVKGTDGQAINFNDADSVQLIVQDTPKNDEVLARVLVDVRVENIKLNSQRLAKEVQADYRVVQEKYDYTTQTLASLTFNDSVAAFNEEKSQLMAMTAFADAMEGKTDFLTAPKVITIMQLEQDSAIASFASAIPDFKMVEDTLLTSYKEESPQLHSMLDLLENLQQLGFLQADTGAVKGLLQLRTAAKVAQALTILTKAMYAGLSAQDNVATFKHNKIEMTQIRNEIERRCTVVQCPVKGEVYYSEQECIPRYD